MAYKNNLKNSFPWKQAIIVVLVLIVIAGIYILKNPISTGEVNQIVGESNSTQSTVSDEMTTDSNSNQVSSSENEQTSETDVINAPDEESEQKTMEANISSEESFIKNSVDTKLPKLVDLGSGTCIPCQEMAPILEELKNEYDEIIDVDVVDVYEDPEKTNEYNEIHPIYVIPTQILFDEDGNEVWSHEGFIPKDELIQIFSEKLGID